jgi:hypothetical protein
MTIHAARDAAERGHLLGDVPALFLVAVVLGLLAPRGRRPPDRQTVFEFHESDR